MSKLPIPHNEQERLERLKSFRILDTSPEAQFDDLTELAAYICDVPICLISLIDEERQWFKSKIGLDVSETSRDLSFCQYAIMESSIFEVEDSLKDPRFADNPLVTGDPKVRFYSGAPLIDDEGFSLGTLCVIDQKPKSLTEKQKESLRRIANTVMRMIRLHKMNEEHKEYYKLFELSKDMLCIGGLKGYYKNLNPAFTEILGWSKEELMSRPFLEFVHPDDSLTTIKEFEKLEQGKVMKGFINRYRTKSGEYKWLSWTCQPALESGQLFAVAHDVSELKKANEQALKSVMAKDIFLANISHEIRTPLNAIIGFTDLLFRTNMNEEQEKYLNTISIASDNLLMLINNVLDLSKIESGNLELEIKPLSIEKVINDVIRLISQKAHEKDLTIRSSVDSEIPDLLLGDSVRLTQILLNLISNAVKFTQEGEINLQAKLVEKFSNEVQINFVVEDTGIGIPQDKIDAMFERFTQAESSTTRKYGGTGLGLNIVKRLVELHQGTVHVNSQVNKGTTFTVGIRYPITQEEIQAKQVMSNELTQKDPLGHMHILLVEDNEHNQILAKTYLIKNKAHVDIAENGKKAVELVLKNNYDCIIMDLQMPVMNGFEATRIIREDLHLDIPILACTAHSLVGEKTKSMEVGMNDYITKPYSESELVETVLRHVKGIQNNVSPDNSQPISDDVIGILKTLENDLGTDFVDAMMSVFRKRIPEDIKDLKLFLKENDFDGIAKKAHLIAGSCGSLKFSTGHMISKELERLAKNRSINEIPEKVHLLIDYLQDIILTLKQEIQSSA